MAENIRITKIRIPIFSTTDDFSTKERILLTLTEYTFITCEFTCVFRDYYYLTSFDFTIISMSTYHCLNKFGKSSKYLFS